jgi:hypothetical protein
MHQDLALELVKQHQERLRGDAARLRLRSTAKRARPTLERARSFANRWHRRSGNTADNVERPSRRSATLDELAERVATQGPGAVELELRQFIRYATARGVTHVLLSVLADPRQPDVARQRAFGRIHVELERSPAKPTRPNLNENDAA